jgi:hypothetical protein
MPWPLEKDDRLKRTRWSDVLSSGACFWSSSPPSSPWLAFSLGSSRSPTHRQHHLRQRLTPPTTAAPTLHRRWQQVGCGMRSLSRTARSLVCKVISPAGEHHEQHREIRQKCGGVKVTLQERDDHVSSIGANVIVVTMTLASGNPSARHLTRPSVVS